MSVGAAVRCLDCGASAPDPGDCGHVGLPSLDEADLAGDFVAFERIYRGYAALGLRLLALDAIRSWLIAHASHRVELGYEGEPVRPARRPASGSFRAQGPHRPGDYTRAFVELSCEACGARARIGSSTLMLPCDERPSRARLAEFERVLDVAPENFYRTSGLLDAGSEDLQLVRAFLRKHVRHAPRVRSITGETWWAPGSRPAVPAATPALHTEPLGGAQRVLARASLPAPLKLAWKRAGSVKAPLLVSDGIVFTTAGAREWLIALDPEGAEIWRTPSFGDRGLWSAALAAGRIWLPVYENATSSYRLWSVDPATGRTELVAEDAPSIETFVAPGEFLGRRYRPNGREVESVGRFEIGAGVRARWELEIPSEPLKGMLAGAVAFDGERVFASRGPTVLALDGASGSELWRADLSSHGRWWGTGDYLQLSAGAATVVYGLIMSLHALDTRSGANVWSRSGPELSHYRAHYGDRLWVAGQHTFSGTPYESLCLVLELSTGRELGRTGGDAWKTAPQPPPRYTTLPRPTDDVVWLGDLDGRLWALSQDTLDPVWMAGLEGARSGVDRIVIAAGRLFATLYDGTLYCLAPASA